MTISAWDGYWRHTDAAAAHRAGGPQEAVLRDFWLRVFESTLTDRAQVRTLDVACGNGVVTGYLFEYRDKAGPSGLTLRAHGLDGSTAALADLRRQRPGVAAIAGDARRLPFKPATFDLVMSQFGFEYGGVDAIGEAARVLAAGGTLAALLHLRGGGIYRECEVNAIAIATMQTLLERARETLIAGITVSRAQGDVAAFRAADRRFVPAVAAVEALFRSHGRQITGGVVHRLYTDIGHMYKHLSRYDAADVVAWLDRMDAEMATYAQRMQAMLGVALDDARVTAICGQLLEAGLQIRDRGQLRLGAAQAAAWTLVAHRPASP